MNTRYVLCAALTVAGVSAVARAQESLYVLTDYLFPQLRKVDPNSGAVITSVTVTGHEALFGGLAVDAARNLYSIDGYNDPNPDRLFKINRDTGAGAVVGPTGFNWNFRTVCVNPATNVLYAATDNTLYTINTSTGAATVVANIAGPSLDQLTALAINAQGQAYITDIGDTDLFSLNLSTGQATRIGSVGGSGNWFDDLAFNSAGVLYGSRANGGVYTIATATAVQTLKFFAIARGLAFVPDTVPCYPDCNGDGVLGLADFGCFQTKFALNDPYADCNGDGVLGLADFGCFQTKFALGCP
jgi:hypothetical protein